MREKSLFPTGAMQLCIRLVGAWGVLALLASLAQSQEPANPQARAAAQLFNRYCVQCHGTDGKGDPGRKTLPAIPDFTDAVWQKSRTNIQMRISVLEGKDQQMPSNRGQVTDAQAAELVAYVRTFGPAEPVAPTVPAEPAEPTAPQVPSSEPSLPSSPAGEPDLKQLFREFAEREKQLLALSVAPPKAKPAPPPPVVRPTPPPTSPPPAPPAPTPKVTKRSTAPGAAEFFAQNCAGCHTIGAGSLTGPDLKNVAARRDRDWLVKYLQNPKAAFDSGDAYALHLLAEARGVVMPKPFGMNQERAESILEMIEAESKLEKSQFAGPPVSDAPFPPGNADRGRELFVGQRAFANGGPACITCHTSYGLDQQEGGKLGPELTKAFERLGGRASLTARLWSPATPTMLPVYKDHALELDEVMCLVAYLEQEDKQGVEQSSAPPVKFFLMGVGGAILGLATVSLLFGSRTGPRHPLQEAAMPSDKVDRDGLTPAPSDGVALSASD